MYYDYSCSVDHHGLAYPGFSVVFLQQFSIDSVREFCADKEAFAHGLMRNKVKSIDDLMFIMSRDEKKNIRRFEFEDFDFELSMDEPYPLTMKGKVHVEMALLFEHVISFTYRFVFDNKSCTLSADAATDHIITLLSTHLSAEHWSKNKDQDETDINLEVDGFRIKGLYLDEDGRLVSEQPGEEDMAGDGRVFDSVSKRFRKFVLRSCTRFRDGVSKHDRKIYERKEEELLNDSLHDFHYAMVDIWETIKHPLEDGTDLFDTEREEDRLSEAQIVNHIRDMHKPELIGLMTMYPGEWPYRDAEAFQECCGENVAIDTDDLVLANNNIALVIGTYGRRGQDSPVDWEEHLQERSKYHVSWPEYLLILEMVLAKKYVIANVSNQLINATLNVESQSSTDIIANNAELSMRLSRMELQMDVVKYSKFMSHKVMFDRTTKRLDLDKDIQRLHEMIDIVDNSLHNLSDYKSMKSDNLLNIILALISVVSTFELFFQNTEMPFLSYFGIEDNKFAALLVWGVASITCFALLLVSVGAIKSLIAKIRSLI